MSYCIAKAVSVSSDPFAPDYSYDKWGSLTNTVYSDGTPTIALSYDALGRQTEAHDAAGITTFIYDSFGSLTNEAVFGVAGTNTIIRHWDNFGRNAGYALNGTRQSTLAYDPATGRLASMLAAGSETPFVWNYLDGSDLKSSLVYPNSLTATWTYDANNLLLQVCNATPTNIISQYDYTYDAAGRRVACGKSGSAFAQDDTVAYAYNNRSELTNAVAAVDSDYRYAYDFDDIGNRESSSERGTNSVYTANQLNQYTEISDSALSASPRETFTPQFDLDGNQTLIKTSAGIWQVTYNGENRPILWTCIQSDNQAITNNQTISMSFDLMGRRVTKNDQRFVYDGYLQIADNGGNAYIWDTTEPVATRPLVWNCGASAAYYTHDGNTNVSEVIAANGDVAAHYEYAPFGAVTARSGASAAANPWRFSSEYAEDDTATVYYNYRHYEPVTGRWITRDSIEERGGINLMEMVGNRVAFAVDMLGLGWTWRYGIPVFLYKRCCGDEIYDPAKKCCINDKTYDITPHDTEVSYYCKYRRWYGVFLMPIVRPFNPSHWVLTHCWFKVGEDRFGAYPSSEGGVIGMLVPGMGGSSDTIRDEASNEDNHPDSEGQFLVIRSNVRLSGCKYDIDKFNSCVKRHRPKQDPRVQWMVGPHWYWMLKYSNCRDFVLDTVRKCKIEALRK